MKKYYPLKRIMYPTMNSWNGEYAPAYNLKIHHTVADPNLRSKLYDLISLDEFWIEINDLVHDFDAENAPYSVGFNGRSGGYLVLYRGKTCAGFEPKDVPTSVLKAFRKLAMDIVRTAVYIAEHTEIVDEDVTYTRTEKCLKWK